MTCNVAFIGLGVMGYPMAGYISKAGHNVTVFNRTKAKAEKWISEYKGKIAETPAEAAKDAEYVFTCVGNDNDLREVTFGENGALTVMIGGDQADFDKTQDKIDCYSKKMKLLGSAGSGQLAKMVNQICIAGLVQGLSEGINFGMKAGLNMEDVIEVISKGAAQSWQMENRYKTMIDDKFDFGFAVDWMRKDLKIAMEEAKNNGSPLPITEIVDKYYGEVQELGGNRWDTSSLIKRFRK